MPIFDYVGEDATGKQHRGSLHGSSSEAIVDQLGQKGIQVSNIWPHNPENSFQQVVQPTSVPNEPETERRSWVATDLWGPVFGRVPLGQLSFFFRQAASMLGAGVNPVQTFETLGAQTKNSKLAEINRNLAEHTLAGKPMSASMQRYPEVFQPLVMSMVRAGEQGGFLESALNQIADYIDREIELRTLYRRATFYPKMVVVAALVILTAANAIISSVAPNSPIRLSQPLLGPFGAVLAVVVVGLFLFVRVGLHNPRIRYNFDLFVSLLPVFGRTMHEFAMAKFGRALGALYRAGLPIHRALSLSADACGNEYVRARIHRSIDRIEQGEGLAKTLQSSNAFNPVVMNMISTGEQTGDLDLMLGKMAEFYEREASTRSLQVGVATGVLALLVVAVYVGYIFITNLGSTLGGAYQKAASEAAGLIVVRWLTG